MPPGRAGSAELCLSLRLSRWLNHRKTGEFYTEEGIVTDDVQLSPRLPSLTSDQWLGSGSAWPNRRSPGNVMGGAELLVGSRLGTKY